MRFIVGRILVNGGSQQIVSAFVNRQSHVVQAAEFADYNVLQPFFGAESEPRIGFHVTSERRSYIVRRGNSRSDGVQHERPDVGKLVEQNFFYLFRAELVSDNRLDFLNALDARRHGDFAFLSVRRRGVSQGIFAEAAGNDFCVQLVEVLQSKFFDNFRFSRYAEVGNVQKRVADFFGFQSSHRPCRGGIYFVGYDCHKRRIAFCAFVAAFDLNAAADFCGRSGVNDVVVGIKARYFAAFHCEEVAAQILLDARFGVDFFGNGVVYNSFYVFCFCPDESHALFRVDAAVHNHLDCVVAFRAGVGGFDGNHAFGKCAGGSEVKLIGAVGTCDRAELVAHGDDFIAEVSERLHDSGRSFHCVCVFGIGKLFDGFADFHGFGVGVFHLLFCKVVDVDALHSERDVHGDAFCAFRHVERHVDILEPAFSGKSQIRYAGSAEDVDVVLDIRKFRRRAVDGNGFAGNGKSVHRNLRGVRRRIDYAKMLFRQFDVRVSFFVRSFEGFDFGEQTFQLRFQSRVHFDVRVLFVIGQFVGGQAGIFGRIEVGRVRVRLDFFAVGVDDIRVVAVDSDNFVSEVEVFGVDVKVHIAEHDEQNDARHNHKEFHGSGLVLFLSQFLADDEVDVVFRLHRKLVEKARPFLFGDFFFLFFFRSARTARKFEFHKLTSLSSCR